MISMALEKLRKELFQLAREQDGMPSWLPFWIDDPIHPYYDQRDKVIVEGKDDDRQVKATLRIFPQVNIPGRNLISFNEGAPKTEVVPGGNIVTLKNDSTAVYALDGAERRAIVEDPKKWIAIAVKALGTELVMIEITATATRPESNDFAWSYSDVTVEIIPLWVNV